jgi:hypothetical protein
MPPLDGLAPPLASEQPDSAQKASQPVVTMLRRAREMAVMVVRLLEARSAAHRPSVTGARRTGSTRAPASQHLAADQPASLASK